MALKDLPADAQPREKLLARGPAALADAELLAILLRTGLAGCGVLQLAQSLLDAPRTDPATGHIRGGFDGLAGLLNASAQDLTRIKGLGPAKRAELVAVMELARRATTQQLRARTVFTDPGAVKHHLQLYLAQRPHEVFAALFLDSQNRLIALEELFRGTLSQIRIPYQRNFNARFGRPNGLRRVATGCRRKTAGRQSVISQKCAFAR